MAGWNERTKKGRKEKGTCTQSRPKTRTRTTFGRKPDNGGGVRLPWKQGDFMESWTEILWLGFCGICRVKLDQRTQKISCEVNKPICWNTHHSPSLSRSMTCQVISPKQIHYQFEQRCHIPSDWASNVPWSCTHINKKHRTWHSVCGERSDLYASPSLSSPTAVTCRPYYNM